MSTPARSGAGERSILRHLPPDAQGGIIEDADWRPRREALLREVVEAKKNSGWLIGILSPLTLDFRGQTFLQMLGLEEPLAVLVKECGSPRCPACGEIARQGSLAGIAERWRAFDGGTLMVAVKLEAEERAAGSLLEVLEYWGAQRVFDGTRIWNAQQIGEGDVLIEDDSPLYVILDSASLPVTAGFETQLMTLLERTRANDGGSLTLFVRHTNGEPVQTLGDISLGWVCSRCQATVPTDEGTPLFIGDVDCRAIPALTPDALSDLLHANGITAKEIRSTLDQVKRGGGSELPLNASLDSLALSERYLIKLLLAVVLKLSDAVVIVDDALELFTPEQLQRYETLTELLRAERNIVCPLASSPVKCPVIGSGISAGVVVPCAAGEILIPERGIVEIIGVRLAEVHRAAEALVQSKAAPWKETSLMTIEQLRSGSDRTVAAELGLIPICIDLLCASAEIRAAGFTASELKRLICPKCLALGSRDDGHQGQGACSCGSLSDRCNQLLSLTIKGRKLSSWCAAALADVLPLFAGYARSTRLLEALTETELAGYPMNTPVDHIPDLHRQVLKTFARVSALEVDLYRRNSARRTAPPSLYLIEYPFLGLTRTVAATVMRVLEELVLPDDTLGYSGTQQRFNSSTRRAMVTHRDPVRAGDI